MFGRINSPTSTPAVNPTQQKLTFGFSICPGTACANFHTNARTVSVIGALVVDVEVVGVLLFRQPANRPARGHNSIGSQRFKRRPFYASQFDFRMIPSTILNFRNEIVKIENRNRKRKPTHTGLEPINQSTYTPANIHTHLITCCCCWRANRARNVYRWPVCRSVQSVSQ